MRILILNRFYWPDETGTAIHATDVAEDLAAAGHEVHAICARLGYDKPDDSLPAYERRNNVQIHRLWSTRLGRATPLRRLFDLATFQLSLRFLAPWQCKPDAMFVMTDPPMVLGAARWIQILRGGRICHFTADIYPEIAVQLGAMKANSLWAHWLSRKYERWLGHCAKVFALGETTAAVLQKKGVALDRIIITKPWADGTRLGSIPHLENPFRKDMGLRDGDLAVMYSGNMGRGHGFETILNAIEQLSGESNLKFFFVGSGAQRGSIERFVREKKLECVRLLPFQPLARLRESLSAADIHLVSQDPRTVGLIVPSKFAGALASGRPVVFVGDRRAEIAQCISQNECGFHIQEGDAKGLVVRIQELHRDTNLRERMGQRARGVFEAEYDRKVVVPRIIAAMTN